MNAQQDRHLDREAAEMLLRGGRPPGAPAGTGPVAGVLAAAAAPARDRELTGEAKAVAAFHVARLRPATRTRRPALSVTKLLAVKAALALAGVAGGGVALAAATGHLHPDAGGGPSSAGLVGASATSAVATPAQARPTPAGHHAPSPSPSLRGLCQAYTAGVGNNPGKALENPAFTALIRAAGGRGNVAAYCASLLASKPGRGHTAPHGHGKHLGSSASHSAGRPPSQPNGRSAARS